MYNGEIKGEYIRETVFSGSSVKRLTVIFNSFEKFEIEFQKDLAEFSNSEIEAAINTLSTRSATLASISSSVRSYIRWCDDNNKFANVNKSVSFKQETSSEKVTSELVRSPKHLQGELDKVFPPEDEHTASNAIRAFIWLAYIGVDQDDAVDIDSSSVDCDNGILHYNGKSVPIYKYAMKSIYDCATLPYFYRNNTLMNDGNNVRTFRLDGNLLLRPTVPRQTGRTTVQSVLTRKNTLRSSLYRALSNCERDVIHITYENIKMSGLFWRLLTKEETEEQITWKDVFLESPSWSGNESTIETLSKKEKELSKLIIKDYEKWKSAYFY